MTNKNLKLLDLFSGAGGAAMGYHRAGFTAIVGVDIAPQPRYPFQLVQADALDYLRRHGHEFDAIHASPPCQGYLDGSLQQPYPRLVSRCRELLQTIGRPFVIENVMGAHSEMQAPVMLCGAMFPELKVYRHRLFDSNVPLMVPPHPPHVERFPRAGRGANENGWICVCGNMANPNAGRAAMGINWTNRRELGEAIPPAYTEFIGRQLVASITAQRLAA